jgi:putative ABC transport system permease protein
MLQNYFTIAWRNLLKGRAYSLINVIGLATGMAIALLIGLWIADELSFNHYYTNYKRIAQGMIIQTSPEESYTGDVVSMPMGQAFRTQFPDLFKKTALTCGGNDRLIAAGDKKLAAPTIWAQRELPEIFTFKMVKGTTASLDDPSTAIISRSLARALFGNDDAIGKTVRLDNRIDFKIGGVYEDLPSNVTFAGTKVVLPWYNEDNNYHHSNTEWDDHNGRLFVELADNVTAAQASARIKKLPTPFIKGWVEEALVHPLDKVHLYDKFTNGKVTGGRITFVWLFGIIGSFVLLLACINFMNLSTARSEKRAKEVGIRKAIGSLRKQLIGQFLSESIIMAILAFMLAIVLVAFSLSYFNNLAAKQMIIPWGSPVFWGVAMGFVLFTGLLAGSYPAFYLSSFEPVKVLKGVFRAGRYASLPRQILVVLQFSVSVTLIIGTVIVFRQIQHSKDRSVGYKREGLITVDMNTPELYQHYDALRQSLLQSGTVENVAASSMKVTDFDNGNGLTWRGKRSDQEAIFFRDVNVTRDFGKTIGWKVIQGRDFSRAFATDSNAMILNEAAVKVIGIKDPVGETMSCFGKKYTVIGVVNDMVTNSPYDKVEPAMFLGDRYLSVITIRIKPGQPVNKALAVIGSVFKKYNPGSPFLYQFMDDRYALKFQAEQRIGNLASVFTTLAIFISCLGLFGLASFVAERRTKEIGVRKILGAGIYTIWSLLSKEFIKLTAISLLIAIPLSYWIMHQWLQNYTYRTSMPWWIFVSAGAGILLITLITVSFQALKAALMNPVKSLRTE